MADNAFVGRGAYLTQILGRDLERDQAGSFFVVTGIPGIGKTELLNELERIARKEDNDDLVIRVSGRRHQAPGRRRDASSLDEAAEFRYLKMLLKDAIPDYLEDAADVQNRAEHPGWGGHLSTRREAAHEPSQVIDVIEAATETMTRAAGYVQGRLLVVVDDFHLLAGRPLGDWIMRWLMGIRGADVVLTHVHGPDERDLEWPSPAILLPLGNLNHDDVERYLAGRPGIGPDVTGIIGPVWDLTGGHPQALALVADLLMESGGTGDAVREIRQLRELPGGLADHLESLVKRIFRAIDNTELRDALYSLCVTRHFDKTLLARLLSVEPSHAQTLIDQIRQFSFVTESHVGHSFLAIDGFVRRIGEQFSARREEIHEVAAGYYHDLIVEETAEDESWSQAWHRYEDPRFQDLEKDWLYHRSNLTGRHRRSGRLEIARIFLDGFWLWGCYVPFPFCEEILADWMSASSDDEDRKWGQALRDVYDFYPRGGRVEAAPREQWVKVRRALRQLWDQGGFAEDRPQTHHVRAVLEFLLADTLRFINPGDARVDQLLDDAVEQLAGQDGYIVAWIGFSRADLALLRGQTGEAMTLARQAAQDRVALDDHELIAILHRVCADAHWALAEYGSALDCHARAVAHAYRAQVQNAPDAYTIAFQQEMVDRCLERMMTLHADGDGSAREVLRSACARIRAFFGPYWLESGADEVADVALEVTRALDDDMPGEAAGLLFPAGAPEVDTDITRYGSEWESICRDVSAEMADELASLPDTPLPPVAA